ncbi:lytic transglycosylase domain-containing protein [Actinocorallia longicatena]|uniref:Lytic transglycosylase domain-containing protein n=1 Tax=Actinocorallia longicatena TaxID=111803 RepID=A0ABP6Q435_9ACTN
MSEAPQSAWDPAGPETPYPDVKVAGIALAELEREELAERPVRLVPDYAPRPSGPGRVFVTGAVAAVVLVLGASVYAIATSGDDGKAPDVQAVETLAPPADAKPTPVKVDPKQDAKLRRERAANAAAKDKSPKLVVKAAPTEPADADDPSEGAGPPVAPGTAQAIAKGLMPGQGWDPKTQFGCLYNLWMRESGWRTTAGRVNGPYGIPQANPGTKMASAGPKWKTDAATQIKWGFGYIKGRYKTPCGAWGHFQANHWY